ncbi:MAG: sugar ABC transporter permease [Eubacteriales bacterium]|nr:sugar ABC transporter permease [Eubacteriales bacterium]
MKKSKLVFWGFQTPCLLAFSLAILLPMAMGIYYSFTEWNGIGSNAVPNGLTNYVTIFTDDSQFLYSFRYTLVFSVAAVVLVNLLALGLALLVTQKFRGSNLFRSIFFLPNLIGGILVGFIWQFIFTDVFDGLGTLLSIPWLCNWLSTPQTATAGLLIVVVWQMSGYMMLIYIAQIQNIPDSLLEAASIDGATRFQRFWHVKLPMLTPAFTVGIFLTLANCFKLYDQNLTLTQGGPYNSSEMLTMNIYNTAFSMNKFGQAQAKGVVYLIVVAVITLTQLFFFKRREVEL